jgi:hypothetical protein
VYIAGGSVQVPTTDYTIIASPAFGGAIRRLNWDFVGSMESEINLNVKLIIEYSTGSAGSLPVASSDVNITTSGFTGSLSTLTSPTENVQSAFAALDSSLEVRLSTTVGIDAKTAANNLLYTVPVGRTAVITKAFIRMSDDSGFLGVGDAGIGANGPADDIFASQTLTGLDGLTKVFPLIHSGAFVVATSGQAINFGIDVVFTGTTIELDVDLFGYLI